MFFFFQTTAHLSDLSDFDLSLNSFSPLTRATCHLHYLHYSGLLQHFLKSLFLNEINLDFFLCSVTLQEIVDTELLDKKYNEDEARVSANHLQNAYHRRLS